MSEPQTPPQQTPEPPAPTEAPPADTSLEQNKDARQYAMLCHLLAIFTGFIGPLIMWLIKKDDHAFVNEQGKEALNFQLTIMIAWVASFVMMFVCIGYLLMPAVWVINLVFTIMATVAANKGQHYRYPICIRFIK